MTLDELARRLEASERPTAQRVAELTQLALQLRRAGVRPTLEACADRASLAAWVSAERWEADPTRAVAEALVAHDGGESIYMALANEIADELDRREGR